MQSIEALNTEALRKPSVKTELLSSGHTFVLQTYFFWVKFRVLTHGVERIYGPCLSTLSNAHKICVH